MNVKRRQSREWNPAGSVSYQQTYPLTVECKSNSIKPVTLYRRQQTLIQLNSMIFDLYDCLLQSGMRLKLLSRNPDLTLPTTAAGKTRFKQEETLSGTSL